MQETPVDVNKCLTRLTLTGGDILFVFVLFRVDTTELKSLQPKLQSLLAAEVSLKEFAQSVSMTSYDLDTDAIECHFFFLYCGLSFFSVLCLT